MPGAENCEDYPGPVGHAMTADPPVLRKIPTALAKRYCDDPVRDHFERAGVARQKWPAVLQQVDDYPRTASGKVQKYVVRQHFTAEKGI